MRKKYGLYYRIKVIENEEIYLKNLNNSYNKIINYITHDAFVIYSLFRIDIIFEWVSIK